MKRFLTALVMVPLVILAVLYSPSWLFAFWVGGVSLLALYEFFTLAAASNVRCFTIFGYVSGAAMIFSLFRLDLQIILALLISLLLVSFLVALAALDDLHAALTSISATCFGVFYTTFLLGLLIPIRAFSGPSAAANYPYIFFPMIVTWAGDIGAYYVGRRFGRHKLAPRVSPKKTLEGAAGGVLASVAAGLVFHRFYSLHDTAVGIAILATVISVVGQFGDAAESLLKRGAGMKDSSALIPGHGGILDRIDSLLFAIPTMYLYLLMR
ncbi:MAG: phosphatidate cytidylyltransferase [Acidobacteria bacterium]|nr:phosphatidate cytidylyltransferase [Acidobacteriota bacterium]MBI3657832.1 phosphatidate cytidylyltransferase [Acidobacteriota bacterium]